MNNIFDGEEFFPIEKLTLPLSHNDLNVNEKTMTAILKLEELLKTRNRDSSPNYTTADAFSGLRVVFTGPTGTGKKLAAFQLANETGIEVYRIDLSKIVSKYIGETEKNLDKLFSCAEAADVILYFDEADALFGKRTRIRDNHDRYGNMEVSWLLQRIYSFHGILILAFNKPLNTESPFFNRFDLIVEFEKAENSQRQKIWKKYLPF